MKNNPEKNRDEDLAQLKFLLLPIAPLFLYYLENHIQLALNPKNWTKARMNRFRKPALLIANLVISSILLLSVFRFLALKEFYLAGITYGLFILSQTPLARVFLLVKMNQVNTQNQLGIINPSQTYQLRKARYLHSCAYAEKTYTDIRKNIDLPINFIGKRVEPTFVKLPIFGEPKVEDSELQSVVQDDLAVFPLNAKSPDHHLVIGQTGSGKTTLITRMIGAALNEHWRVIILDLKGDPSDINKFLLLEDDQSRVRHFPSSAYDFWQGTKDEIAERVISFLPGDTEPFYLNRNSNAIRAVIVRSALPAPKSVEELINRIRNGAKLSTNQNDTQFFLNKERGVSTGELIANDLISYLDPIRDIEMKSPYRFHWKDDWNLALFTLDGFEPSSLRIADALLHDFASWIFSDERAMNKTPILLIIDEASAFSAIPKIPILSSLIQRARSAQVSLVFASQNLAAFKDEKDNLLHSGAIRWLGSSTEVEEMVEAAGTRSVVEAGFQFEGDKYTGVLTHRNQREFKIDPDFVRELPTFHWFVSSRGKVSSVFIPPINWQG